MIRYLLFPFSLLYRFVLYLRNKLYDWGILKSVKPEVKTIVIGNLSLGGTGKTPHTEYIIRLLKDQFKISVLSRGYKRKTKGFILADSTSIADQIGDEPKQYQDKFRDLIVAVDEDRIHGINQLVKSFPNLDCVLLDDAFQHRRLRSDMNIVLTSYNHLYKDDHVLPMGTLRDHPNQIKRANVVVVTKCPSSSSAENRIKIRDKLSLQTYQKLFFSGIRYGKIIDQNGNVLPENTEILALTGIAKPKDFLDHCRLNHNVSKTLTFKDHYHFLASDLDRFGSILAKFASIQKAIVTTEKDFVKLKHLNSLRENPLPLFYLPIEVYWMENSVEFDHTLIKHLSNE